MSDPHSKQNTGIIDVKVRIMLMSIRQGLIMVVCAIEDYLGIQHKRTIPKEVRYPKE